MKLHLFSSSISLRHPADDDSPSGTQSRADRDSANDNKSGNRDVSAKAYELWEKSGYPDGTHLENWYEAERQLKAPHEGQTVAPETAAVAQPITPRPTPTAKPAPATDAPPRSSGRRK